MTAATDDPPLLWRGDPTIIVLAVRYAVGRSGSDAPDLVAQAVILNAARLPESARRIIIRAILGWLDFAGASATASRREPWVRALGALGIDREVEPELPR